MREGGASGSGRAPAWSMSPPANGRSLQSLSPLKLRLTLALSADPGAVHPTLALSPPSSEQLQVLGAE